MQTTTQADRPSRDDQLESGAMPAAWVVPPRLSATPAGPWQPALQQTNSVLALGDT